MSLTQMIVGVYVLNVCGCFLFIAGVLIYNANKLRAANKAFSTLVILASVWMFNAGFIARLEPSLLFNLRFGAMLAAGLVYVMPFIFEAIRNPRRGLRWIAPNLRAWFVFSVVLGVMPYFGSFIAWDSSSLLPTYGPLWPIQHALIAIAMFYLGAKSWSAEKRLDPRRARELRFTVTASAATVATISASYCFLTKEHPLPKAELGVFIVVYMCALAWGLLIRGVYSFGALMRLFLKYFSSLIAAVFIYALLRLAVPLFIGEHPFIETLVGLAGAVWTGIVVFTFFLREQNAGMHHSVADFQQRLANITHGAVDSEVASTALAKELATYAGTKIVFLTKESDPGFYYFDDLIYIERKNIKWEMTGCSAWVTGEHLLDGETVVEKDFEKWSLRNELTLLMLSSRSSQRCNLCVAFGERIDGHGYTYEELEKLSLMVDSVAVAITSVETGEEARQSGKAIAIGLVSASVLHEVKQPLASLKLFMHLLPDSYADAAFRNEYFGLVRLEVNRIEQYLLDLLQFGGATKFNIQTLDPYSSVRATIDLLRIKTDALKVTVTLSAAPSQVLIQCDIGVLKQAMLNLMLNALDSLATSASAKREIFVSVHSDGETVYLKVTDNGPGIPKEILKRLFRPFVTGKDSGTGLGLFITRDLIVRCGGNIEALNNPDGGACFVVSFPLAKPSRAPFET